MTIPTPYLWPLGCLAMIGLVHAVFAVEEVAYKIMHRSPMTDKGMPRDESKVRDAERIVLSRAVEFVQACLYCQYAIAEYGEGEAELHSAQVRQSEEDLHTAVADLLAAEAAS